MPSRKTPPEPPGCPAPDPPQFEESIRRLGEIVETLEGGDLPLEQSLKLFEEGVRIARVSQSTLDKAEQRVEELLSIDEEGNPIVRELAQETD